MALEILEALEQSVESSESITDLDIELTQSELDPDQARLHPKIFKIDRKEIEECIDKIYSAAAAGDPRAKYLIHAAASNQLVSAQEAAAAFPGGYFVTPDELESYEEANQIKDSQSSPIATPVGSIEFLDAGSAAAELAYDTYHRVSPLVTPLDS